MIHLGKGNLWQYLEENDKFIKDCIQNEKKEKILNGNKTLYLKQLEQNVSINPPTLKFGKDEIKIEIAKKLFNIGANPVTLMPTGSEKEVMAIKILCEGTEKELNVLQYMNVEQFFNVYYKEKYVCFDVDKSSDNKQTATNVKMSIDRFEGVYKTFLEQIDKYNETLESKIEQIYDNYKHKLEEDDELINQIKNEL